MYKIILLIDFSEEYSKSLLRGITKYSKEHGPWVFCRMPTFYRESYEIEGHRLWDVIRQGRGNDVLGEYGYEEANNHYFPIPASQNLSN